MSKSCRFGTIPLRSEFAPTPEEGSYPMARPFEPGVSLHVIRRGINGAEVFLDDTDRRTFLRLIACASTDNDVAVHGFVLMDTHYHFLVTPAHKQALSGAMKALGEDYVRYFNRRHKRIGTLWSGRYRAIPITDERYWFTCLRYIEQNPLRARMVSSPDAYRWSSCRAHMVGEPIEWLVDHPLYVGLGRTVEERQIAYRALCGVPLTEDELVRQRVLTARRRVLQSEPVSSGRVLMAGPSLASG
jgi:putative transposase